jgi:hypothetical protein
MVGSTLRIFCMAASDQWFSPKKWTSLADDRPS